MQIDLKNNTVNSIVYRAYRSKNDGLNLSSRYFIAIHSHPWLVRLACWSVFSRPSGRSWAMTLDLFPQNDIFLALCSTHICIFLLSSEGWHCEQTRRYASSWTGIANKFRRTLSTSFRSHTEWHLLRKWLNFRTHDVQEENSSQQDKGKVQVCRAYELTRFIPIPLLCQH